ncbi:Follistatin-related protein 1, partial [Lamprotornis superbus]
GHEHRRGAKGNGRGPRRSPPWEGRGHRRGAARSGRGPGRSRPRGGGRARPGVEPRTGGSGRGAAFPFPSRASRSWGRRLRNSSCPAGASRSMIWKTLPLLCALLAAARLRAEEEPRSKSKICANVFCGAGRECAVTEKGEPTCLCIEKCKPHKRPVCGSNGKTYLNHCELHRDACLTGSKIQVDYDGHCKEKKSENPAASPVWDCSYQDESPPGCSSTSFGNGKEELRQECCFPAVPHGVTNSPSTFQHMTHLLGSDIVCYQSDRDELRRRVIHWLEAEIIPDGWFSKGTSFFVKKRDNGTCLTKASKCYSFDDGDSRLDSTEFLKFVEQNETAINITTYMDQETNRLLRGLCVDALIELSDENADWKLSFNEFLKCLSPSFNPPEKKCALEDETYEDGAETQVECNRCVCACGNWVCTAMTCEGRNEKVPAQTYGPDQDLTEEEMARYIEELQKHQETAEKTKRMSTKEM